MSKSKITKCFLAMVLFFTLVKWISNYRNKHPELEEEDNKDQIEEVVILLKPGAATPSIEERLNSFLEKRSLEVAQRKIVRFNEEMVREFYPHSREIFIPETAEYFSTSEVIALHVTGKGAVDICVKLKNAYVVISI